MLLRSAAERHLSELASRGGPGMLRIDLQADALDARSRASVSALVILYDIARFGNPAVQLIRARLAHECENVHKRNRAKTTTWRCAIRRTSPPDRNRSRSEAYRGSLSQSNLREVCRQADLGCSATTSRSARTAREKPGPGKSAEGRDDAIILHSANIASSET